MPRKDPEARRAYMRAYYQANREKQIATAKAWQKAHPERARELNREWYGRKGAEYRGTHTAQIQAAQARYYAAHPEQKAIGNRIQRMRRYGLTITGYEAMLTQQGGVCALCRKAETHKARDGKVTLLAVDHDHATGSVRALLCHACNVGLGSFLDDPALLHAAAGYVESFNVRGSLR